MGTTIEPADSTPDRPPSDPADERSRPTLRFLSTVADIEASDAVYSEVVPTGPAFVRDVMITGVVAAHEGAVFKKIVDAITRNRISAVPVIDAQRRVIGVVSESDLLARVSGGRLTHPRGHRLAAHREDGATLHAATARELMTSPAVVTTPDTPIGDAAGQAADARVRRLPVVDRNGVLVGIVTRADLLRPFLRSDAEICADIRQNVVGEFIVKPRDVDVSVCDGVVTMRGRLEGKLAVDSFVAAVQGVCGVVDVDDSDLTYRRDDTLMAPTVTY